MKKNYNIRLNPKPLRDEQIAKYQDFDALLNRYHHTHEKPKRTPLVRSLVVLGLAIAASIAILLFFTVGIDTQSYEEKESAYFAAHQYVNPPFENVKPQFASYQVNAEKGGTYNHQTGSKITIPTSAFVDNNGLMVNGEVTIFYREMHDYVDFFLSGIPMTYDSAGVQYTLESAGMIEIFAEQDGKRINMAPGKSIDVELVSIVNMSPSLNVPPGYNIYQLDEQNRNWVYKEIDRMQIVDDLVENSFSSESNENNPLIQLQKTKSEKLQTIQVNLDNELAKIEERIPKPKQPIKPSLANNNDYVFDLDFNDLKNKNALGAEAEAQEELAALYRQYEKMLWQLSPNESISAEELQEGFSNVTGISIKKLNARDYQLKLEKNNTSLVVVVNPVLSGNDYQEALAEFNRDFEKWEQLIDERNGKLQAVKNEAIQKYEEEKRKADAEFEERVADLQASGLYNAASTEIIKRKVINRFQATGFGIWNCDRPLPPDLMILAANFESIDGEKYENRTAYLVDKNRNTVYQLLAEDGARFRFNRNSQNLLWLVTKDNKIAVFRPEDFKGISADAKEFTFVMETVDKQINDEDDVREVLLL